MTPPPRSTSPAPAPDPASAGTNPAEGGLVNPFAGVTDVGRLRAVIDALTGLVEEVNQDTAVMAPPRGVDPPRIAGIREVKVLALRRRQWALAQLAGLRHESRPHGPRVLDPAVLSDRAATTSSQVGYSVVPVVTAANTPAGGVSTGYLWMPPQHYAPACVHHHTSVVVLVLSGAAVTVWWDDHGDRHELAHEPGQHLSMPPGVPHALINPHPAPLIAVKFRDNPLFHADTEACPALTPAREHRR